MVEGPFIDDFERQQVFDGRGFYGEEQDPSFGGGGGGGGGGGCGVGGCGCVGLGAVVVVGVALLLIASQAGLISLDDGRFTRSRWSGGLVCETAELGVQLRLDVGSASDGRQEVEALITYWSDALDPDAELLGERALLGAVADGQLALLAKLDAGEEPAPYELRSLTTAFDESESRVIEAAVDAPQCSSVALVRR